MSLVFSGSYSGSFVSTGLPYLLQLPAGIDSVRVRNETIEAAAGANTICRSYWNKNTVQGGGMCDIKTAGTNAIAPTSIGANLGFFWYNNSNADPGTPRALTAISGALPGVVSTTNTAGLIPGVSIVRIMSTVGALQLRGVDFTVGTVVDSTSFTLAHMDAIVAASPGAGTYAVVPYAPSMYPSTRVITKINNHSTLPACPAGSSVITLSVNHTYVIGQKVKLQIPQVSTTGFGTTSRFNGQVVTITGIGVSDGTSTNTITVNLDTTGFTFAWPLTTDPKFTPAMVIPNGMDTAECIRQGVSVHNPRIYDNTQQGLLLMAGAMSPAGVAGNVISWEAFKSYNT